MTAPQPAIAVKELEWEEYEANWWGADTGSLRLGYEVRQSDSGTTRIRLPSQPWDTFEGSPEAAKAAAQADYETRIRSALIASPPPSGEVEALRKLIRWAYEALYEINPSNYDHGEVCKLNDASVEVILGLAQTLGEKCGKTTEWWAEYRKAHPGPALSNAPATADGWRDDPSADERWNAGLDYGQTQLCTVLGVDPANVSWDAATETLDGDVQSVISNILRARFGDDWRSEGKPVAWRVFGEPDLPVHFARTKADAEHLVNNLLTYRKGCTKAWAEPLFADRLPAAPTATGGRS